MNKFLTYFTNLFNKGCVLLNPESPSFLEVLAPAPVLKFNCQLQPAMQQSVFRHLVFTRHNNLDHLRSLLLHIRSLYVIAGLFYRHDDGASLQREAGLSGTEGHLRPF